jgi:hypothetical protein
MTMAKSKIREVLPFRLLLHYAPIQLLILEYEPFAKPLGIHPLPLWWLWL